MECKNLLFQQRLLATIFLPPLLERVMQQLKFKALLFYDSFYVL